MDSKILITCKNSIDAQLIKNQLENDGIKSYLLNENFSNLLPHMYNVLGGGVQIMVHKDDLIKAKKIIGTTESPIVCPKCGSKNLTDMPANQKNKFVAFIIALFLVGPIGNLLGNYKCNECGMDLVDNKVKPACGLTHHQYLPGSIYLSLIEKIGSKLMQLQLDVLFIIKRI